MWKFFSGILLRNKLIFTVSVLLLSAFMAYETSRMELSYEFAKILPDNDSTFIDYQNFKKQFGEDGNVMVMGFADKNLFQYEKFRDWQELSKNVKKIQGIKEIISLPTIFKLVKNDSLEKFEVEPLVQHPISSQKEVDSLKAEILNLPFYEGLVYNKETGATLLVITFKKKDLDSKRRLTIVDEIKILGDAFSKKYDIDMHYSGMPYIRSAANDKGFA